jgi:hypothetical protein
MKKSRSKNFVFRGFPLKGTIAVDLFFISLFSDVKSIFRWLGTLHGVRFSLSPSLYWALGFIFLFTVPTWSPDSYRKLFSNINCRSSVYAKIVVACVKSRAM